MSLPISITLSRPKPSRQLYQLRDDIGIWGTARSCASGGCPAVVPLTEQDEPDVWFTKGWQFSLYAANKGMSLNAINAIMGQAKAFMNGTAIDDDPPRNNYLTGNTGYAKDPATDKFRTTCLSIHAGRDDGTWMYPEAMDGTKEPPMKPGRRVPKTLAEIVPDDYLYTPWEYPELWVICSNVKWKVDPKRLAYGPFANGIQRPWRQAIGDHEIYTYFPFVTTQAVRTPLRWWSKLDPRAPLPAYYRR